MRFHDPFVHVGRESEIVGVDYQLFSGDQNRVSRMVRNFLGFARTIGLTPEEFRRRNFLSTGMHTATGQHLSDPVDMDHLLTRALAESNYHVKRAEFDRTNPTSTVKRGIGFAAFMHGSGFTGSGERRLNSLVKVDLTAEGHPRILVSSTEFGQGTNTIL